MTSTASAPHLRPMPRYTFAGRGCRDPRRELRRRPAALLARATTATAPAVCATQPATATATATATASAPPTAGSAGSSDERQSAAGGGGAAAADHPRPSLDGGPHQLAFQGSRRRN